MTENFPKTKKEAVSKVLDLLKTAPEEFNAFKKMPEEDLIFLHQTLGREIRNRFGMWEQNEDLLKDIGKKHPDDASMEIIRTAWKELKGE